MTAEVGRQSRARANFDALLDYKREGERRRIPEVIREIWVERQWLDLGYRSYGEACTAILGEDWRNPWSVDDRREVVSELRESGMSTRAIASAVGVSDGTVRTDLDQLRSSTQLPETITGLDGKTRPARVTQTTRTTEATKVEHAVDLETGEILGEEVTSEQWERENQPSRPTTPKRRPLVDQIRDATHDLVKATERVERLLADDRYPRNAEQVASFTRGDLLRAAESLHRALDRVASASASA